MSRGPGRVERSIRRLMDVRPDEAFTIGDLCWWVYPAISLVERKHRNAVLRAANRIVEGDDTWRLGCVANDRRGAPLGLYNAGSRRSIAHLLARSANDPSPYLRNVVERYRERAAARVQELLLSHADFIDCLHEDRPAEP
jgi:hypothetical protein